MSGDIERLYRSVLFLFAAIVPVILFHTAVQAGTIKSDLDSRLRKAGAQDEIAVIITLKDQVDLQSFKGSSRKELVPGMKSALMNKADKSQKNLKQFLQGKKAKKVVSFWIFNGMAATVRAGDVRELAGLPEVNSVQLDGVVTLEQPVPAAASVPEWNVTAVNAPDLWNLGYDGTGVVVAGMDTGVDAAHQDLTARWRGGGNSWFDPYGEHLAPFDSNGHGTQTMGIMVGGDADGTAIGMAPGAQWIAVKIFNDQDLASYSAIHSGFQWLLDPDGNPATDDLPDVVNNSWGFDQAPDECLSEFQLDVRALRTAGMAVLFSSGNTGPNASTSISPANYPESFAVGAVDDILNLADFSGRGPTPCSGNLYPDVVAPGVNIKAPDLTFGLYQDSYTYVSGTSFSAPVVSGAMALLRSADQQLSVDELETSLAQSAVDLGEAGSDYDYGHGFIDVAAAYDLIQSGQGLCIDRDGDGFFLEPTCPGVQDCNDNNPGVYPGADEIKHDSIDQDCNGYDLTIDIFRSDYRQVRDGLVIFATSDLNAGAQLQADIPGIGVQPMTWSWSRNLWRVVITDAVAVHGYDPAAPETLVTVSGPEGMDSVPITNK